MSVSFRHAPDCDGAKETSAKIIVLEEWRRAHGVPGRPIDNIGLLSDERWPDSHDHFNHPLRPQPGSSSS